MKIMSQHYIIIYTPSVSVHINAYLFNWVKGFKSFNIVTISIVIAWVKNFWVLHELNQTLQ